MKKLLLASTIIILVLTTAIIKNTTKKIEDKIFAYKESVRLLKSDLENIQLEYDYLSSAEKLLEYQSKLTNDDIPPILPKFFKNEGKWVGLLPGDQDYDNY